MQTLINSFVQYCEVEKWFSEQIISEYKKRLTAFLEFINDIPIDKVSPQTIRDYLKQFDTIHKRIGVVSALKCFGKMLKAEGKRDPFAHLERIKAPKKIPIILSKNEIEKLFSLLETPEEKIVFEVIYSSAVRISEYMRLETKDIDFKKGLVRINKGKMGSAGIVPIGKRAITLIKKYGLPKLTKGEIYVMFHKYSILLGKRVHPHMLRKNCASDMLNAGADIRYVQEQLRHKNINSTVIYTKVCPETLKKMRDCLDDKDALEGRLPYFPPEKPYEPTPEEVYREGEFKDIISGVLKREEVNPLLGETRTAKALGINEQTVRKYAEKGDLKGEYTPGAGWGFRHFYIKHAQLVNPAWLIKCRRPNPLDITRRIMTILRVENKLFNLEGRISTKKRGKYLTAKDLSARLGVSQSYIYKVIVPFIKKEIEREARRRQKKIYARTQKAKPTQLKDDEIWKELERIEV